MNSGSPGASAGSGGAAPALYLVSGLLVGLLVAGVVAFFAWPISAPAAGPAAGAAGGPAPDGGAPPSPVDVTPVVEIVAAEAIELLATAQAVRESLVASEVDGLVVGLSIDEGSTVRAGDPMANLRTFEIEQQLAAARASLQETQARLTQAESDVRRYSDLRERNVISESELEQAVTERDAFARALDRLEAEVAQLQERFERARVRAPFSGRVTGLSVEVGEWVGRGDPIATLVDLSEIEIRVQIAERFISAVRPGFPVTVRVDALPGEEFQGLVTTVVPAALPEARTFPVLVRVDNPDERIKPGMAARVHAQLGSPQPTLMVSKDAIVRRGSDVFVMKVGPMRPGPGGAPDAGMIVQVPVVLGPARGLWQVVEGDLAPGDRVVVRGNERVFPGQPVSVAEVREPPLPTADPDRPIALDPRSGDGR